MQALIYQLIQKNIALEEDIEAIGAGHKGSADQEAHGIILKRTEDICTILQGHCKADSLPPNNDVISRLLWIEKHLRDALNNSSKRDPEMSAEILRPSKEEIPELRPQIISADSDDECFQ